jgi:hypothetical protein
MLFWSRLVRPRSLVNLTGLMVPPCPEREDGAHVPPR